MGQVFPVGFGRLFGAFEGFGFMMHGGVDVSLFLMLAAYILVVSC
jgi:hypothetical protein